MNNALICIVTNEEIREAVFAIKPSSAPGIDGMTGFFFQKYWDIIGYEVSKEVKCFFVSGSFPSEWNYTLLCLIPKIPQAKEMTDLRPISLCSVFYKIISNILVKRLQPFLAEIVSPTQSAFVPERLISDNVLIAHEVVHALRTHPTISEEFMAIKSDMSKAYDRVEWSYVRSLLAALGFHQQWIQWVMFCITSVSYSVLISDHPQKRIYPSRGLRQGDPLSPSLFVLCTECLTHLLSKAEQSEEIHGVCFSPSGPTIHHLLFADDSLFLCKASEPESRALQNILGVYGEATGQVINLTKSSITFGSKVHPSAKVKIQETFGIFNEGGAGTYLGLPECFSGSKADLLGYIQDRLKARLTGWFARTLSHGGKEILLKAVALALPVYAMSCFKLPKSTIKKLSRAMADFWWNSVDHKRKIHWISWEKMCLSKKLGGLGFKDIERFNQALLAKQAWRLLQAPDCLFSRLFKSRYFADFEFLSSALGTRPSFAWRSILFGRNLLLKGLKRMVGDGQSIRVWIDPWIEDNIMRCPWMKNPNIDLMPAVHSTDFWSWRFNKNGDFSVKSAYWLACQFNKSDAQREAEIQPSFNGIKEKIWFLQTAPKVKTFLWRVLSDDFPVAENLITRGVKIETCCNLCGFEGETSNHVLFTCSLARQIWALSGFPSPQNGFHQESIHVNVHYLMLMSKNIRVPPDIRRIFPWVLWRLWKNRNKFLYGGIKYRANDTIEKILEEVNVWFLSQDVETEVGEREKIRKKGDKTRWRLPPFPWLKWVVLLHSRRSFSAIDSIMDAKMCCMLWSLESMVFHRINHVVFAAEEADILGIMSRPMAWPSYKAHFWELNQFLVRFSNWKVEVVSRAANRGAFLIAQSALEDHFHQSYVASSHPFWLHGLFENEKSSASM
ncbi:unnamed protein product [Microthlaspi erraticum]|uniref:Reverse transcriptase domain-containing protein n=1 Tax=Microthlaspi erraticum TaxID=1685480 RepID=A0A6D2K4R6_9BRAS|nr:unnamed protein product [Microthlaspi erraticum]